MSSAGAGTLLVHGQGRHYLFGPKGNQPNLHALAEKMFNGSPGGLKKREVEPRNGFVIVRELHTLTVNEVAEVDMVGAQQMWRVRGEMGGRLLPDFLLALALDGDPPGVAVLPHRALHR